MFSNGNSGKKTKNEQMTLDELRMNRNLMMEIAAKKKELKL